MMMASPPSLLFSPPSSRLLCFLLLVTALLLVDVVSGQESPTLNLQMYKEYNSDEKTFYRQNVCDRHDLYYEGIVELRDALSGENVNVYVPVWDDFYFKLRRISTLDNNADTTEDDDTIMTWNENGDIIASTNVVIDETNPGLIAEILDEIGKRGNFTWRNSYGYTPSPEKVVALADPLSRDIAINKTWTDLLLWSTQHYDISADEWFHTNERMKMGITFPEGFVDASIILADNVDDDDESDEKGFSFLWSWTKPFNGAVWAMIVGTAILSGLIYGMLETSHDTLDEQFDHFIGSHNPTDIPTLTDGDGRNEGKAPTMTNSSTTISSTLLHLSTSLYGITLIYFQHVILYPKTIPGKIMVCSIGFWSLVMVATYTANLASFFVI